VPRLSGSWDHRQETAGASPALARRRTRHETKYRLRRLCLRTDRRKTLSRATARRAFGLYRSARRSKGDSPYGSVGLAAAQQPRAQNNALVNGALAVPGAPANTDTVPAKFSQKNAADDKLITLAYTFKTLTDDERHAIYQGLKDRPAGSAFNADVGTELPPGIELRPVPDEVAARVPQTRGYRYAVAKDRVLLVGTSRVVVGVFAD
jgi:hypothetical protein